MILGCLLLLCSSLVTGLRFCDDHSIDDSKVNFRIIGGQVAEAGANPWNAVVVFLNSSGYGTLCGATVVDEFWLLTAAHCITGSTEKSYAITGIRDNMTKTRPIKIKRLVPHPDYNPLSTHNDISLVETYTSTLEAGAQPICLMWDDSRLLASRKFGIVSGFGLRLAASSKGTRLLNLEPSNVLLQTTVPILSSHDCKTDWSRISLDSVHIARNQICAGSLMHGTAPGDSGGPLIVSDDKGRQVQIGITSFGAEGLEGLLDQGTYPGVYTRVSSYVPWMEAVVNIEKQITYITLVLLACLLAY